MAGTRDPASCFHQASNSFRDMPSAAHTEAIDSPPPKRCRISWLVSFIAVAPLLRGFPLHPHTVGPTNAIPALTPRTSRTVRTRFQFPDKARTQWLARFAGLLHLPGWLFPDVPDWERATRHRPVLHPASPFRHRWMRTRFRSQSMPCGRSGDRCRRVFRRDPRIIARIADPAVAVVEIIREPCPALPDRAWSGSRCAVGRHSGDSPELAHRILSTRRAGPSGRASGLPFGDGAGRHSGAILFHQALGVKHTHTLRLAAAIEHLRFTGVSGTPPRSKCSPTSARCAVARVHHHPLAMLIDPDLADAVMIEMQCRRSSPAPDSTA